MYSAGIFLLNWFQLSGRVWIQNEMRANLENLSNVDLRYAMDLFNVPRSRFLGWRFHLGVEHLEDPLQGSILDDGKWTMALKKPQGDKVSELSLVV